jgi:hypothetical protein
MYNDEKINIFITLIEFHMYVQVNFLHPIIMTQERRALM